MPRVNFSHTIHFCRQCGTSVEQRVPDDGDTKVRAICPACGTIHYQNPLNVVGTVPYLGDRVLLCKRNIEPRRGFWTLPAGFMELGESTAEGALRETQEEAGAEIELEGLFTLLNVARVSQVHMYYRARLLSERFDPGHETMEARLFQQHEIPWEEIAFRTVKETLEHFFADQQRGSFGFYTGDIN
jgi:ADP-ribose pyrophosphatase YjhB (NUDIX family)